MDGEAESVRCPCGNLNCFGLLRKDPEALGVTQYKFGDFGFECFAFSELHHMSFAVGVPEKVEASVLEDGVYEIACSQCGEIFGFFEVGAGFVLAFRRDLPSVGVGRMMYGELLKLPNLPKVLGSYVCQGYGQMSRSPNSYVDFTQFVPRECDFGEVLAYDSDMDVMFAPNFRDCFAEPFEGPQSISFCME
jgi:hypothetical protein